MVSALSRFRSVRPALVTAAAALALAPVAAGTTAPGARVYIVVTVEGSRLEIGSGASAARGQWIVFHIANRGATTARLSFEGRTSAPIAPRRRGVLALFADRRGVFPLVVSTGGRRVSHAFVVY
jgi:hypothetical protein